MDYKQFLQQSSKSELVSFFRRYESYVGENKAGITPEDYYNAQSRKAKEFQKALKQVSDIAYYTGYSADNAAKGVVNLAKKNIEDTSKEVKE